MKTSDLADLPELAISHDDEAILSHLRTIQRAMLLHPEAGLGLYQSLVEEGRLFAQTREGRRWRDRVRDSALLESALLVWQNASAWMTEEASNATAPSALVDAVAQAASSNRRDVLLERLYSALDGER